MTDKLQVQEMEKTQEITYGNETKEIRYVSRDLKILLTYGRRADGNWVPIDFGVYNPRTNTFGYRRIYEGPEVAHWLDEIFTRKGEIWEQGIDESLDQIFNLMMRDME